MNFLKFQQKMLVEVDYREVQKYMKVPQRENFFFKEVCVHLNIELKTVTLKGQIKMI